MNSRVALALVTVVGVRRPGTPPTLEKASVGEEGGHIGSEGRGSSFVAYGKSLLLKKCAGEEKDGCGWCRPTCHKEQTRQNGGGWL